MRESERTAFVSGRFFQIVTGRPYTILLASFFAILCAATFLKHLHKDTRLESWLEEGHPARLADDRVEQIFGIGSPMILAVVNDGEHGVFDPETLALVLELSNEIAATPGVTPDRIRSLATEKRIAGTPEGLLVEPFYEAAPTTQAEADEIRERVIGTELVRSNLVSDDESGTLIVVEVADHKHQQEIYEQLTALAAGPHPGGAEVHVAGAGALEGYLTAYIDADARRLVPAALVLTLVLLSVAFRTARSVLLPLFVVLGTVVFALGMMAGSGIPWYVLTNAMAVCLVAASVCDGIHILGRYYEELARSPERPVREVVILTMSALWRPIVATSLTSIAGCLSLGLTSAMPPIRAFGVFAAVGLGAALVLSLVAVPAFLVVLRPRLSRAYRPSEDAIVTPDAAGRMTARFGRIAVRSPRVVLVDTGVFGVLAAVGATRLEINDDQLDYFQADEPIRHADRAIAEHFGGSRILNVVIETENEGGLYEPETLRKIEALEEFLSSQPHVVATTSLVDYVKQIHRALHDDDPSRYRIPAEASRNLIAQYFLLYLIGGSADDLAPIVDTPFQTTNVRVRLDSGMWSDVVPLVETVREYLVREVDGAGVRAWAAGPTNHIFARYEELVRSQRLGVPLALGSVWALSILLTGSIAAGTLAMVPVGFALLVVYGVMGFAGIWLGVGTAIFAAIAIGLSVDFCLHFVESLRSLVRETGASLESAFAVLYASTGRSVFFNFIVITIGFGIIGISQVPPLVKFGVLTATCLVGAFVGSFVLLPALVVVLRPRFLEARLEEGPSADVAVTDSPPDARSEAA